MEKQKITKEELKKLVCGYGEKYLNELDKVAEEHNDKIDPLMKLLEGMTCTKIADMILRDIFIIEE